MRAVRWSGAGLGIARGAGVDRLFKLSSLTPVAIRVQSWLYDDGRCFQQDMAAQAYPCVEVTDPRYPYAAPLRVVLE